MNRGRVIGIFALVAACGSDTPWTITLPIVSVTRVRTTATAIWVLGKAASGDAPRLIAISSL